MMQGHASLTIDPVSVRKNTLHGGRCRQWSASYPGDVPTVVLLKARVARTAFRVSSVTVLRAAWMAREYHRSVAYRLIMSESNRRPRGKRRRTQKGSVCIEGQIQAKEEEQQQQTQA